MSENEKKMGKIRKNMLHFMQICWKMEKKGKNWEKRAKKRVKNKKNPFKIMKMKYLSFTNHKILF